VPNDVNVMVNTGITYPSIACHVSGKVFVYNMLCTIDNFAMDAQFNIATSANIVIGTVTGHS
jgi:hypothetical protein